MALPVYDSPTFLTQKDKYLMGLSLPQLIMALGVTFWWFLVTLLLPYGMIIRLGVMGGLSLISMLMLFVQISGLALPKYIGLSLSRLFIKPMFEELAMYVVNGNPVWLEGKKASAEKSGKFGMFKRGKKQLETQEAIAARMEVEAEVANQAQQGAIAIEQLVKDGLRSLARGR